MELRASDGEAPTSPGGMLLEPHSPNRSGRSGPVPRARGPRGGSAMSAAVSGARERLAVMAGGVVKPALSMNGRRFGKWVGVGRSAAPLAKPATAEGSSGCRVSDGSRPAVRAVEPNPDVAPTSGSMPGTRLRSRTHAIRGEPGVKRSCTICRERADGRPRAGASECGGQLTRLPQGAESMSSIHVWTSHPPARSSESRKESSRARGAGDPRARP